MIMTNTFTVPKSTAICWPRENLGWYIVFLTRRKEEEEEGGGGGGEKMGGFFFAYLGFVSPL